MKINLKRTFHFLRCANGTAHDEPALKAAYQHYYSWACGWLIADGSLFLGGARDSIRLWDMNWWYGLLGSLVLLCAVPAWILALVCKSRYRQLKRSSDELAKLQKESDDRGYVS